MPLILIVILVVAMMDLLLFIRINLQNLPPTPSTAYYMIDY